MKKLILSTVISTIALSATFSAQARDTKEFMPLPQIVHSAEFKEKLGDSVRYYFGSQPHPSIIQKLGSGHAMRKTNAVGKADITACNWAFLSAMIALRKQALEMGANAVVNIVSYYNENPMSSTSQYECHVGGLMVGVALKGDFVKI